MSTSATPPVAAARSGTARRIQAEATRLTVERGLDGWTMEDLAAAAGVSRRTLFNHVPGKVGAVIGEVPELDPAALEVFRSGGPTGDLAADLLSLAQQLLRDEDLDHDLGLHVVLMRRRLLTTEPRLLALVHERFAEVSADLTGQILAREGDGFGTARARLVVRVLITVFDCCIDRLAEDEREQRSIGELFEQAFADLRHLLAAPT